MGLNQGAITGCKKWSQHHFKISKQPWIFHLVVYKTNNSTGVIMNFKKFQFLKSFVIFAEYMLQLYGFSWMRALKVTYCQFSIQHSRKIPHSHIWCSSMTHSSVPNWPRVKLRLLSASISSFLNGKGSDKYWPSPEANAGDLRLEMLAIRYDDSQSEQNTTQGYDPTRGTRYQLKQHNIVYTKRIPPTLHLSWSKKN